MNCCEIRNGRAGFLRKFGNGIDKICLLMYERRKSEAETNLRFLDWEVLEG